MRALFRKLLRHSDTCGPPFLTDKGVKNGCMHYRPVVELPQVNKDLRHDDLWEKHLQDYGDFLRHQDRLAGFN